MSVVTLERDRLNRLEKALARLALTSRERRQTLELLSEEGLWGGSTNPEYLSTYPLLFARTVLRDNPLVRERLSALDSLTLPETVETVEELVLALGSSGSSLD